MCPRDILTRYVSGLSTRRSGVSPGMSNHQPLGLLTTLGGVFDVGGLGGGRVELVNL
jgi:hypothetical protein